MEYIFHLLHNTKWINLAAQYKVLDDYLFFDNQTNDITSLLVKPVQYNKTINYLSVKANKEIKFWKLALDNTILYQKNGRKLGNSATKEGNNNNRGKFFN